MTFKTKIALVATMMVAAAPVLTASPLHGADISAPATASVSSSIASTAEEKLNKKLKIAVGRFTNETRYGRSLLRDGDLDPLGKQALDILSSMLTESDRFLVFERPDLVEIKREQANKGERQSTIGVDTLVLGSIVEFGRAAKGKRGLFNRRKDQVARATVTVRLVDVNTGLVFHSATGSGEATTSAKTTLGVGSTAAYDQTLNDRAISAAINQVINELVSTMEGRPWRTDILTVESGAIYLAGGQSQGLRVGDRLTIYKVGKTIKSRDSGFDITLPPSKVGTLKITQLFGDRPQNEGAVAELVDGSVADIPLESLYVAERGAK